MVDLVIACASYLILVQALAHVVRDVTYVYIATS